MFLFRIEREKLLVTDEVPVMADFGGTPDDDLVKTADGDDYTASIANAEDIPVVVGLSRHIDIAKQSPRRRISCSGVPAFHSAGRNRGMNLLGGQR